MKSVRELAIELAEAQALRNENEIDRLEWELFQAEMEAATLINYQKNNEYGISE